MDEHPLLPLLKKIVLEVTGKPARAISTTDDLSDLGIDSVSVAEIVMRIEDELTIEIPASEWLEVRTLQGILDLVDSMHLTPNPANADSKSGPGTLAQ